ncbi:MAG TPA: FAD-dependent oxidoreductase [Bryobacteraceae bacterium]|jgi:NADPH-dependent 2,4-dienoyl-CoA reductase/sulfur reductase-like enzyme/nitrite reductase/ring-hydroxylating ferredoxin subunit|nr:FAD-dependent oxidoreductase [Bryobacteraceae bacterium]
MAEDKKLSGPDLKAGVELSKLTEKEPFLGHYEGEPVILVRQGDHISALAATCTHYGGPLAEGLVVDNTIRCPWHHARFNVHTGEAEGAPALNPVSCFNVRRQRSTVAITGKAEADFRVACPQSPSSVVIIGAGAAGAACADMLRTKGYAGPVTLVADEQPSPVDRPNLSKDYLAGSAPEEWIPLRTPAYYQSIRVDLVTGNPAARLHPETHKVSLKDGRTLTYGGLLLATGAEPCSLRIKGSDLLHVFRLRTLADSNAIIAKAQQARNCVVIGSSFIGLEVAASLRSRGREVTVISQDSVPLGNILGKELGRFVQRLHEKHGVRFLLDTKPQEIHDDKVEIGQGRSVDADLVVLGVGVSPRTSLADEAGIQVDNGVVVDEMLRTSASDVFAAGDIARYPEPVSGEQTRIEHWVVAERQGQSVARAMLGIGGPFRQTPFFWSQHYDVQISYVGHASKWDSCQIEGDPDKSNACAVYRRGDRIIAVATIGRDRLSLQVEAAMEVSKTADLDSLLRAAG